MLQNEQQGGPVTFPGDIGGNPALGYGWTARAGPVGKVPIGDCGSVAVQGRGWGGVLVLQLADVPPPFIDLHRRLVSIEYSEDGASWIPLEARGIRVDDDGYHLSVAFKGDITEAALGVYETRWYNPARKEGRWHRFSIEPGQEQEPFFSRAFQ